MILHTDKVQDEFDRPVSGAQVYVYNIDGSLATLTIDGTVPLSQPILSDEFGIYTYYANTAYYNEDIWYGGKKRWRNANVAVGAPGADLALRADLATSSGYTLVGGLSLVATPQQFQASAGLVLPLGGGVQNDSAAFVAAIAYLQANATAGTYGYGNKGCGVLRVPKGNYYLGSTTLEITATITIEGEGGGFLGGPSTILRWAAGTTGIRTIPADCATGATGPQIANKGYTAAGSVFRNLFLRGGYTAGSESESHGIHLRSFAKCENVYVDNFPGDGFYAVATIGDATTHGNASESSFIDCVATQNRNGFFFDGADSNATKIDGCDSRGNRMWGFWDSSFLGNTFSGCKTSANGWDGAIGSTPTACTIGGSRFYPKPGQATAASTNAPPKSAATITIASPGVVTWTAHGLVAGTPITFATTGALPTGLALGSTGATYYVLAPTTNTFTLAATVGGAAINTSGSQSGVHTAAAGIDNTYWGWLGAGGTFNGIVAWVSGTTFREGGGYKTDNANQGSIFTGCYHETDQNPAQILAPSIVVGGFLSRSQVGSGPAFRADTSGAIQFGPNSGGVQNAATYFDFTNYSGGYHGLWGRSWLGGQSTNVSSIRFYSAGAGGILYDTYQSGSLHNFLVQTVSIATIDANGLTVAAGKSFATPSTAIGGGTALTKAVVYTPSITPSSVSAATVAEQTFTVAGLTTADKVIVNPPAIANATGIAGARVSAADTLAIRFANPTAGSLTPTAGTYTVLALRS